MKSARTLVIVALLLLVASPLLGQPGSNQGSEHAAVLIPDSSLEHAEDVGVRAHTNHLIKFDPQYVGTSPSGETPASIRPVYNLPSTGGVGTIAIVDAFHYATAENDLNVFSSQFGLPACTKANGCFQVVTLGKRSNCGWAQEAALDIEWAHAMAPGASIVLVEAASSSFADLFHAVDIAKALPGVRQVSMSWGGSEFSSEASNDSAHLLQSGVVFFASSGDTGGATIYPGTSPNVVSAGGTTIHRTNGAFTSETGWSGSGGGPSKYEGRPSYQDAISAIVGSARGVPDFSFDADPNSGVSVYDSTSCQGASGWLVFGGTSVSSPSLAGIVNLANGKAASSGDELTMIYLNRATSTDFRDILTGTAGSFTAVPGWDFVTGVGSNQGLSGK
jgi:kumamolisin